MKEPKIWLTYHVDLPIMVDLPDGPGPQERSAYGRAISQKIQDLIGEIPVHVSESEQDFGLYRFSGSLVDVQKIVDRFKAKGGTDGQDDGERSAGPGEG